MGFWDFLHGQPGQLVQAQVAPQIVTSPSIRSLVPTARVSRNDAMSVPAIARARNIICTTAGTLPMHKWNRNGEKMASDRWLTQPDLAMSYATFWSWVVDDLIFYPESYLQILAVYAEDGRPSQFRRVPHDWVTFDLADDQITVSQYYVKQTPVPMNGVGSLITIQSLDEGVLARGSRTIRTAVELENAALLAASEPVPQMVLKNVGMDLPDSQVEKLLAEWREGRRRRSTSYLSSNFELDKISFNPEEIGLNKAREISDSACAMLMNMPQFMIGAETQSSMTYSNQQDIRRDLRDFTLRNPLGAIESRLSMDDITPTGTVIRFGFDDFLRGNPLEQATVLEKLLTNEIITIDDARAVIQMTDKGR